MNQHTAHSFDYLINTQQTQLWDLSEKMEGQYEELSKQLLQLLGVPNNEHYRFLEYNNLLCDEPYNKTYQRCSSQKELLMKIIQNNRNNRFVERNARLQIYHTMNSYTIGIIDYIKDHYKQVYGNELSDNLKYIISGVVSEWFSIEEDGYFGTHHDTLVSFDSYLKTHITNSSLFKEQLFISMTDEDIFYDCNKEKFEFLRKYIYNYINFIIIPEIEQILNKIYFSRESIQNNILLKIQYMKQTGQQLIECIKTTHN